MASHAETLDARFCKKLYDYLQKNTYGLKGQQHPAQAGAPGTNGQGYSNGLKGQQHPAQGNALGTKRQGNFRPEGAKELIYNF
jgi:hypothetical protein